MCGHRVDDVARIVGDARGRPTRHVRITEADLCDRHIRDGIPPAFAALLAGMDSSIAVESEDKVADAVARITGRPARRFADFAKDAAAVWRPV